MRVSGAYRPGYLALGRTAVEDLERVLQPRRLSLRSFQSILDFGSGCARVLRPLRAHIGPGAEIHGTDIDAEAVQWCREHYASLATFETNGALPPLRYGDDSFDLVYCVSVFTHLPEELQFRWLEELNRVVTPDGYLILTTHGEGVYDRLPPGHLEELQASGFIHFDNGKTEGLPDFYLTTFHTPEYVRERWSPYLEVVHIEIGGLRGRQDVVLCRKRR